MEREKLLQEHKATLESLAEKTKFVYSEDFYRMNEFDKQKYIRDKMATEAHLNSLSNLLWNMTYQVNSLTDLVGLGIISSILGSSNYGTIPSSFPSLKEEVKEEIEANE